MLNGNRIKSNRERHPRDFYITPPELADVAFSRLYYTENMTVNYPLVILDAGCGTGIWGKSAYNIFSYTDSGNYYNPCILGVDVFPELEDNNRYYYFTHRKDYLQFIPNLSFGLDMVFGNPPYSLAEEFIRHSFELLEDGGYIYFLLRLSFLEGIARNKGLFKEFPPKRVYVCNRRPSFFSSHGKGHTTDSMAYAMFLWQKGYTGKTELDWLDWDYKK